MLDKIRSNPSATIAFCFLLSAQQLSAYIYPMQTISRKKIFFPINSAFRNYLKLYEREIKLPISYEELRYYDQAIAVYDKEGKDTLWETVFYPQSMVGSIHAGLKRIYSILKAGGDQTAEEHLHIERIDYCTFGNSHPFRIKIVNDFNEVYDYFYIKIADASRIYGLELEHILSPYWMNFLADGTTLVEEHIAGVPGDQFILHYLNRPEFNPKRIAKEFVKFNEHCFVRLLGDMRSYNFVFDITPDFDDVQFRIRAIDFDQHAVIDVRAERLLHSLQIRLVTIAGRLPSRFSSARYQPLAQSRTAAQALAPPP